MAFINLTSRAAQERKLAHLIAAAQGDELALPAWADWLEENGSLRVARQVRYDLQKFCARKGENIHGETGLVWYARYQLTLIAEGLVGKTAFRQFAYGGNWNLDGTMMEPDGSMEAEMRRGYVPTLSRGKARQEKLGRVIEGIGFKVHWIGTD